MRGFNRVIVVGNLARDPEVRSTVSRRSLARFSVAVNYRYRDNNGEYKDGVDFVPVSVWGATADNCGKYLKKGSSVLLEGRVQTRSYDGKDGSKRYVTEVVADSVQFLGSSQGGQRGRGRPESDFGADYIPSDYIPSDDDFGLPIGDKGFGPDSMDDPDSDSGHDSGSDIPF